MTTTQFFFAWIMMKRGIDRENGWLWWWWKALRKTWNTKIETKKFRQLSPNKIFFSCFFRSFLRIFFRSVELYMWRRSPLLFAFYGRRRQSANEADDAKLLEQISSHIIQSFSTRVVFHFISIIVISSMSLRPFRATFFSSTRTVFSGGFLWCEFHLCRIDFFSIYNFYLSTSWRRLWRWGWLSLSVTPHK